MTEDSKYTRQTVTSVHTWVPGKLFSVRVTRDDAYDFQPGQFAGSACRRRMIPTARLPCGAPTMVSAPGQPWLEFYSIVVPEGLFSPRMARLAPGDALYVEKRPMAS